MTPERSPEPEPKPEVEVDEKGWPVDLDEEDDYQYG